jgi:hypothetical protein
VRRSGEQPREPAADGAANAFRYRKLSDAPLGELIGSALR